MDEKVVIRIRKGLNGWALSACDENGNFLMNFPSEEALKENWSYEIKKKKIKLIKEYELLPAGEKPAEKIYGYARVSTPHQAEGYSLEAQEEALKAAGAQIIYKDTFTGKTTDRPELKRLLEELHGGDTLIVTKLDRLARSISQASAMLDELLERRVRIHVLNIGLIDNSPTNKLMRNMLLAFAEFERDMIIERTQEGRQTAREAAKRRGEVFIEGRPKKYSKEQIKHAVELLQDHSYTQVEKMTGISKSTLIREKRENNHEAL